MKIIWTEDTQGAVIETRLAEDHKISIIAFWVG